MTVLLFSSVESAWSFASRGSFFEGKFTEHTNITKRAIQDVTYSLPDVRVVTTNGEAITFHPDALGEIITGNRESDQKSRIDAPLFHFDNELLMESAFFLKALKDQVCTSAINGDGLGARKYLGAALHLLQDYYSHSNWVELQELDGAGESRSYKIKDDLDSGEHVGPPVNGPCPDPPFPGKLGGPGTAQITTGHYVGDHCSPVVVKGTNRCIHGENVPISSSGTCPGLNKDLVWRPRFFPAKSLAIQHTKKFVKEIVECLGNDSSALGALVDRQLCSLPPNPSIQDSNNFCLCQVGPNPTPEDIDMCTCHYQIDLGQFCEGD